jgi:hypothetical protein
VLKELEVKNKMASKKLQQMRDQVAKEMNINLNNEYITAKEAGSVGGEMVKRMIDSYESTMK